MSLNHTFPLENIDIVQGGSAMEIFYWSMLSVFTLLLGAIAGFGLASRKVVIVWYHLAGVLIFSYMVSLSSSFMGHLLGEYISYRFLEIMISLIMIALGVVLFISKPVYPGSKDFLLLSFFVLLDVILLSYRYALSHEGGYGLAFTISLLLIGSIVCGIVLGSKRWANWRLQMIIPYVAPSFIILVGVMKML